ncbi:MAG: PAS domain S-box protein [Gemmataceae bacterium]|nr:PAS domain S-box protein [Gemmataceae bacterium]
MSETRSNQDLLAENRELRRRLADAERTEGRILPYSLSERARIEETTGRLYQQLVEKMQQGAATLSGEGVIIYANHRFAELVGRTTAVVTGVPFATFVAPASQGLLEALLRARGTQGELALQRTDGLKVPVYVAFCPLDAESSISCVIVTDLTDQKRQEQLLASEALARSIIDQAVDATIVCDGEGKVLRVSQSALELCSENPLMRAFESAFPLRTSTDQAFSLAPVRAGATLRALEVFLRRPASEQTDMLISAGPLLDACQRVHGSVVTLTDISARKRAEAALRRSEAHLRQVFEAVPHLVWACEPDFSRHTHNRRWRDFTGINLETADQLRWLDAIHPEDRDGVQAAWMQAIATGSDCEVEQRMRRASDGVCRWYLMRVVPLRDGTGRIIRWFGTCTDIHEQKQAEEVLKETNRRKDEFLAMLAHELRNPLAPIRNAAHLLRMHATDEPQQQWAHDVIERQLEHLTRLVDDLLDVSRLSGGKIKLRKEVLDVATVLTRAVETARPLIDARRHRLRVTLPDEPVHLFADATRLAQVVGNLLNNAAKYTEEGGLIWLEAKRQGPEVIIRVRDTGVGIATDMLPRVFDLFTQVDQTLDRSQGGLGIGLTLVRRLTEKHGGRVHVSSSGPGQGSEFSVWLPVWTEAPPVGPPIASARPVDGRGSGRRVLVVDDKVDAVESLARLLNLIGHETRTAQDGPAALEQARRFRPDVVLLDIGLPGMDGYEVARRLRQRPETARAQLVAVTGYGQEEDRRLSREAGFDLHLVKPVDLTVLQELIAAPAKT